MDIVVLFCYVPLVQRSLSIMTALKADRVRVKNLKLYLDLVVVSNLRLCYKFIFPECSDPLSYI